MKNDDVYNETPIGGYDFSGEKAKKLKELILESGHEEYIKNKKKVQKRKENIYQFTSIGNSSDAVKYIIWINVAIFALTWLIFSAYKSETVQYFALFNMNSEFFRIWQPITSMFLHGGFLHILLNMFMLWQFGNSLENFLGTKKFLQLYLFSGLTSGLLWMLFGTNPAVGASGAICGIFSAFLFIAPEMKVSLFFIIPVKLKHAIYLFGLFSLVFSILSLMNISALGGVAHFGHLGGMIGGILLTYYWRKNQLIATI